MTAAPSTKLDPPIHGSIFVLNGGSSSVKFALFRKQQPPLLLLAGAVEKIGSQDSVLAVKDGQGQAVRRETRPIADHRAALESIMACVEDHLKQYPLAAVGHRIVHGGPSYGRPSKITPEVLTELRRLSPYDPDHMPAELDLLEALSRRYPTVPHVACFDTAFHRDLPAEARLLPIPRKYEAAGVRRYGFHGLSYAFLMKELARTGRRGEAEGRVILAHLGNGVSMAAVRGGRSLDTTMAFTPAAGLPMSTRSGDLDPGLAAYLAGAEGLTAEQFHAMVNKQAGLLGLSETSSDMRDLLERMDRDQRAAEAVALFCYQAKKQIGAYAAAMGGLDTIIFSGGIGERSPVIRARICSDLEFLGVVLDAERNEAQAVVISKEGGRVVVRVIPTDEEREIAESVQELLDAEV